MAIKHWQQWELQLQWANLDDTMYCSQTQSTSLHHKHCSLHSSHFYRITPRATTTAHVKTSTKHKNLDKKAHNVQCAYIAACLHTFQMPTAKAWQERVRQRVLVMRASEAKSQFLRATANEQTDFYLIFYEISMWKGVGAYSCPHFPPVLSLPCI